MLQKGNTEEFNTFLFGKNVEITQIEISKGTVLNLNSKG